MENIPASFIPYRTPHFLEFPGVNDTGEIANILPSQVMAFQLLIYFLVFKLKNIHVEILMFILTTHLGGKRERMGNCCWPRCWCSLHVWLPQVERISHPGCIQWACSAPKPSCSVSRQTRHTEILMEKSFLFPSYTHMENRMFLQSASQ